VPEETSAPNSSQQAGDLGHVGAIADLTIGGDRRRPRLLGDRGDGAGQRGVLGREADRVLQSAAADLALLGEPVQQLVGGTCPVGSDQ
jgi:hypothetical protein